MPDQALITIGSEGVALAEEFNLLARKFEAATKQDLSLQQRIPLVRLEYPRQAGAILLRMVDQGLLRPLLRLSPDWDLRQLISGESNSQLDSQKAIRSKDTVIIDSWFACIRWCLAPKYPEWFGIVWRDHFIHVEKYRGTLDHLCALAKDPVWSIPGSASERTQAGLIARAEVQASACRLLANILGEVGEDLVEHGMATGSPKRAKRGRQRGHRKPDEMESAVVKAHRHGQSFEVTARNAKVYTKDGRPDAKRAERIIRAFKAADPSHKFRRANS